MKKKIVIISFSILAVILTFTLVLLNTPKFKAARQLKLGNKYYQGKEYVKAIDAFSQVVESEPENIDANLNLVKSFIAAKRLMDAEKLLQQVAKLDPKVDIKPLQEDLNLTKEIEASKSNYDKAMNLFSIKSYLDAIPYFSKVIEKDTERYANAQNKIKECKTLFVADNIQKAKQEAEKKRYQAAISFLDLALSVEPANNDALQLRKEYVAAAKEQAEHLVTEEEAVEIANNYAKLKYSSFTSSSQGLEAKGGKQYYVIAVSVKGTDGSLSLVFFYVQQKGGTAYEYDISTDKLKPLN